MLFEQEFVKLQEGFRQVAALSLTRSEGQSAWFDTDEGPLEVSAYAPGILRLRFERKSLPDYELLASAPEAMQASIEAGAEVYRFQAGPLTLEIEPRPVRLRLLDGSLQQDGPRLLLESVTDRTIQGNLRFAPFACKPDEWLVSLALRSQEAIFGLGEKFGPLNRRGQLITSWDRDATGVNAEISYKNTPFAWSSEGWGLFVNTPARVTHGVGYAPWSHRSYILKVEEPNLDLFLIAAETPAQILEKFTWLTGRAPLPPLWSYGMWLSRAYYKTAGELLEVAEKLRERRIPCDVITLDGRAWHKSETRFDFSWDPERYPDPAEFVRQLTALNLRLCLWEYPYLSTRNPLFAELDERKFFLSNPDGSTYIHRWFPPPMDTLIPHLQPSGIFDFTNPEAYAWFRDAHKPLFDIGVAVMKPDYGEAVPEDVVGFNLDRGRRLHNAYALLYNRCAFEASRLYGDGMVWSRAGWTGSQRYPIQWGGDPQGDWEGLAGSIRGGLSWGMSGAPFYAHDVGGFYGSLATSGVLGEGMPEPELYIRWAQAGILSSHTRFHGTSPREPWEFPGQTEAIIRSWLGFRYRLIPYLQECALEANRSGMPVMRAMPLAFPEDPLAWSFDTQYMLGPALLVAPILRPGGEVRLYLPAGAWYDLWSGERLEGSRIIDRVVPIDRYPVFGREGQSLGLGPAVQHTGELQGEIPIQRVKFSGARLQPVF
jgi:alpha-D-xyloside xylohydrolase